MIWFNKSTPIRPMTPTIDSINAHDLKVSFSVSVKYSLNIQKPASFTWENIKLPAPTASTIKFGLVCVATIKGKIIPAVVRPATVAEPTANLITAVISQPRNKGCMFKFFSNSAICPLTPLSTSTCLSAPEPPMISKISATSLIDSA